MCDLHGIWQQGCEMCSSEMQSLMWTAWTSMCKHLAESMRPALESPSSTAKAH